MSVSFSLSVGHSVIYNVLEDFDYLYINTQPYALIATWNQKLKPVTMVLRALDILRVGALDSNLQS